MNYHKDNSNKQKTKSKKQKIIQLIIIIMIITLISTIAILYMKNEQFRDFFDKYILKKEVSEENLPEIERYSLKETNIFAYNKYILTLEQNTLKFYNKLAKEEYALNVEISTPIFEAEGNYLCIAEQKGQKIYFISHKDIIWEKEVEGTVTGISVNSNGYVVAIVTGTSYKSVVITYDTKGNELFKKYLSTTSVIDAEISKDNKYLAIAEINCSGVLVQSNIEIISIEEAKNNSSEPIKYNYMVEPDNLIINIKYNNKNELICMYDKHIDMLYDGQNNQLLNFNNEKVLFADINSSSKIIKIIEEKDGLFTSNIKLQIINSGNIQNNSTHKIEHNPKQLYVYDNKIGVNLGTTAVFLDSNGWLVKKYNSNQEIQKIIVSNNIAGIICKNKIKILSF